MEDVLGLTRGIDLASVGFLAHVILVFKVFLSVQAKVDLLQPFLLIISYVEALHRRTPLVVIIHLLVLQRRNHVIDQLDDLVEANLLAAHTQESDTSDS